MYIKIILRGNLAWGEGRREGQVTSSNSSPYNYYIKTGSHSFKLPFSVEWYSFKLSFSVGWYILMG